MSVPERAPPSGLPANVTVISIRPMYGADQVCFATFLGGPVGGGWLMAKELELEFAGDLERMAAFETISQAADNLRRLREESDQCISAPITFSGGESSNSYTGPRAPDDPTRGLTNHPIEPPAYASPYN